MLLTCVKVKFFLIYAFIGFLLESPDLVTNFRLQDDYKVQPAELSFVSIVVDSPWTIKVLFGIMCDRLAMSGKHFSTFASACFLNIGIAWLALTFNDVCLLGYIVLLTIASVFLVILDVISDANMINYAKQENRKNKGNLQSLVWFSRSVGGLTAGAINTFFLKRNGIDYTGLNWQSYYCINSILPLVLCLVILAFNDYNEKEKDSSFREFLVGIRECFSKRSIFGPLLFIITLGVTPSSGTAMYYYLSEPKEVGGLGFSTHFLGFLGLAAYGSMIVGALIYQRCLRHKNIRHMFIFTILTSTTISFSQLLIIFGIVQKIGVSPQYFVLSDDLLVHVTHQFLTLPMVVLAANIIPKNSKATVYAFLMSVSNLSAMAGQAFGATLTKYMHVEKQGDKFNFENLWILVTLCSAAKLIPLIFIKFIPKHIDVN